MAATKRRQAQANSPKPTISLKQHLSPTADSQVYREICQLLQIVSCRVREDFYRDIVSTQLAQMPLKTSRVVSRALKDLQQRVKQSIQKPLVCKDYSDFLVKEKQALYKGGVDELLRKHKLAESLRAKGELEEKLKQVNFDIGNLAEEKAPIVNRTNLKNSQARKHFFQEQEQLTSEVNEAAQRLRKDQLERKRRLNERQQQLEAKIIQEKAAAEREKLLSKEQLEEIYREKLQRMQVELEKRRRSRALKMERDLSALHQVKLKKPLYIKMQEDFNSQVELPEKAKGALVGKESIHSLAKTQEVNVSDLKHDKVKKSLKNERTQMEQSYSFKAYSTKFTEAILEQQRQDKIEAERLDKERKIRADKMKNYGNLVKTLHPPKIDDQKVEELERLKKKIHHSIQSKHIRLSARNSLSPEARPLKVVRPRKLRTISLNETPEFKATDYLAERRKDRTEYDPTDNLLTRIKDKMAVLTGLT